MAGTIVLIDASSSLYRAFYALPALANSSGVPTHATLGFATMLMKVLRERRPDYAVVVWDAPAPGRREALYPQYKANREATPDDLRAQLPWIRRLVEAHRLATAELAGEEADDVIATLTRRARAAGLRVEIVSTDKDLMQLVDEETALLDTMRDRRFGPAEVEERFGVPPALVLDVRALTGDSSDNIPGVRGIGEKGAAQLIRAYGSLDALLEQAEQVEAKRQREALLAGRAEALLSRELSRLRDDLPLELDLERARVGAPDRAALAGIYRELELKRLLEELGEPEAEPARPAAPIDARVARTPEEIAAVAARLAGVERAALGCVLDPEEPISGALVGIAVATEAGEAAWIDPAELGEARTLEALRPVLEDPARVWTGFELKRAAVACARRGVALAGRLRDCGLAAYVDDPSQQVQRPEVLARAYLGRTLPAPEDVFGKGARRRGAGAVGAEELAAFHGARAAAALELLPAIERKLGGTRQLRVFEEIEVPLTGVLARMEEAGVRIDEEALASLGFEIEAELKSRESRIHELAGGPFNIGSPKQLQQVLFEKLQLPPTKRTKTGFSTDESVLEELAFDYELPREILTWRKLAKLQSTYVDALPRLVNPETGRIHTSFNQTVAATGRLSSSNPNLQNIPVRTPLGQRIREAFVAAEGRVLLSADYSQIELRILAHLSRDEPLLAAFRNREDVHVRTASHIFGIPPEAVSEEQRGRMKAINFGIIYGSSAFGIARQLGISQASAKEHIEAYFARYPGVRAFLSGAMARAREQGYAETLEGRRRYLPDLRSRNRVLRAAAERMAVNSVIQGTAADLIKRAMVEIDQELGRPGAPEARMILQVHDELLFEVRPGALERLRELVAQRMSGVAQLEVPLEVRLGSGRSWREAH